MRAGDISENVTGSHQLKDHSTLPPKYVLIVVLSFYTLGLCPKYPHTQWTCRVIWTTHFFTKAHTTNMASVQMCS